MKRLHCIVEGQTEVTVFMKLLAPYISEKTGGTYCLFTPIQHSRGGIVKFSKIIPELRRHLKETKIVTTYFDYYGINNNHEFKYYNEAKNDQANPKVGVEKLEQGMKEYLETENINTRYFIPYIQLHEFEALLFSSSECYGSVYNINIENDIKTIKNRYPNPEDINDSPQTAPSKRLKKIFNKYNEDYQKIIDGEILAEEISIETMLESCPRFNQWVEALINELNKL